jgi:hypothetical protein
MENVQNAINELSKYFGRQFLFEGEVCTVDDCKISVNSNMDVIEKCFIAYFYDNGIRRYRFDFDIVTVKRGLRY